jgi:hypothetical protein
MYVVRRLTIFNILRFRVRCDESKFDLVQLLALDLGQF